MSLHYHMAYGHRLSSTIPLPELRSAEPGPVRWRFSVVDRLPDVDLDLLGEQPIYHEVSARLFRHPTGYRIVVDDTGTYDLTDGTHEIRWLPRDDPWWDFGRSHLIGRVLATSLQVSGAVTLHGSAVVMGDGVVGFLAPKQYGKSTLAMTLFQAGARFVTDDALVLTASQRIEVLPGIQSLRVRPDDEGAHRLLGVHVDGEPGRDGKVFLPPFPEERSLTDPAPLSALYFLRPREPTVTKPVDRTPVAGVLAAVRLMGQTKVGAMLGSSFAPALLDATTAIAERVPIHELAVARDLERLPAVADRLVEWHGLPGTVPAAREE